MVPPAESPPLLEAFEELGDVPSSLVEVADSGTTETGGNTAGVEGVSVEMAEIATVDHGDVDEVSVWASVADIELVDSVNAELSVGRVSELVSDEMPGVNVHHCVEHVSAVTNVVSVLSVVVKVVSVIVRVR